MAHVHSRQMLKACRHFVGLGALITVALLGTQTFVQNVIVTRSSLVPYDQECSVYILTEYGWHSQERSGQVTGDQRPIAPMIGMMSPESHFSHVATKFHHFDRSH